MAKSKTTQTTTTASMEDRLKDIITMRATANDAVEAAKLKAQGAMVTMADQLAALVKGNTWDYEEGIKTVVASLKMKGPQVSEYGVFCKASRDGYYDSVKAAALAFLATPKSNSEAKRPPQYKLMLDMCRAKAREGLSDDKLKGKFKIEGEPDVNDAQALVASQNVRRGGGATTATKPPVIVDGKKVDWKAAVAMMLQIEVATDGALSFRAQIDAIRNKIAPTLFNEADGTKSLPPAPPMQPTAAATIAANTGAPVDLDAMLNQKIGTALSGVENRLAALIAAAKA